TVWLFRRQPKIAVTVPAVLTGSGAVAAVMSSSAGRLFQGYHLTSRPDDWIAVAGYFVMVFCLAIGMLPRSRPRHRIAHAGLSALVAIGLVSAIFAGHAPDAYV